LTEGDLWCFVVCVPVTARSQADTQGRAAGVTELVAAARVGDAAANDALWARCSVVAKRIARRWAGSAADADDLSQEALLRAFESFDALRNPAAINGWMQVIVKHSVGRRRRAHTAGDNDPEVLPSRDPLPDFQVDLRRLLATLGSLPEEERDCFWLRRCEGLRIEEIARETALSPSTIHRRLNVAARRLAKRLREPMPALNAP
jgi:RNA polymerase sigma-70 factor (ECF subfamily)